MRNHIARNWKDLGRCLVLLAALLAIPNLVAAGPPEIIVYNGKLTGIGEASLIIVGDNEAVLIDGQWLLSDGRALTEVIAQTGKPLTHILITHGHPDHYMGLGPVVKRFPEAKVLTREPIRSEIALEFPAKWVHWSTVFGDELPKQPVVPEAFDGESITLSNFTVNFIDMVPAETRAATVFHIPEAKALITGDVVFSKMPGSGLKTIHERVGS